MSSRTNVLDLLLPCSITSNVNIYYSVTARIRMMPSHTQGWSA